MLPLLPAVTAIIQEVGLEQGLGPQYSRSPSQLAAWPCPGGKLSLSRGRNQGPVGTRNKNLCHFLGGTCLNSTHLA